MIAAACDDYAEELVAYLDGEHLDAERMRVEAHVGTCLACRRELERLRRVRTLLGELRPVEPSAGFEAAMWRRLEETGPRRSVGRRVLLWGAPALAAAAVVALASYSLLTRVGERGVSGSPAEVAVGTREEAPRVAREAPPADAQPVQRDVASADRGDLEQYPPELVEHPELFLRLPVVRRLDKLEHFEEVRQHGEGEPVGLLVPPTPAVG